MYFYDEISGQKWGNWQFENEDQQWNILYIILYGIIPPAAGASAWGNYMS
mgnify:CR=1 FL=1